MTERSNDLCVPSFFLLFDSNYSIRQSGGLSGAAVLAGTFGDLLSPGPGSVEFLTSGDPDQYLPRMRALFSLPVDP